MEKEKIFSFLFSPATSHKGKIPKGSVEICQWRGIISDIDRGFGNIKYIQREKRGRLYWDVASKSSSSSAFVVKLIEWAEQERVKKIKPIYNEENWDNGSVYKIDNIYIEKWTDEEIKNNSSEWKCLDCGTSGEIEGQFIKWCFNCNSKNLEVRLGGYNCTLIQCSSCKGLKDIEFHNLSSEENEEKKKEWKRNSEVLGYASEWCDCSQFNTRSYGKVNKPNYLPWIIGGALLISLIGIVIWLVIEKKKND